jgi:hypothetical protein
MARERIRVWDAGGWSEPAMQECHRLSVLMQWEQSCSSSCHSYADRSQATPVGTAADGSDRPHGISTERIKRCDV